MTFQIEFFTRNETLISIVDGEEGVLFVHYPDGRSTGDAFVMVNTEEQAIQALLKHKESMGARYIELFRSTSAEVQQVCRRDENSFENRMSIKVFRRSQDPKNFQTLIKEMPFAPLSILTPDMLTNRNRRDCIRLRNLPIDCGIEQILEFLGGHSQHIVRAHLQLSPTTSISLLDCSRCSYGLQYSCKFMLKKND